MGMVVMGTDAEGLRDALSLGQPTIPPMVAPPPLHLLGNENFRIDGASPSSNGFCRSQNSKINAEGVFYRCGRPTQTCSQTLWSLVVAQP